MPLERLALPALAPGLVPELAIWRFGSSGRGPKVYVQGGLHADEAPGTHAAICLARLLAALPAEAILGEIILVPVANPIGFAQRVLGVQIGRFGLHDGRNFNRGYPDVTPEVISALDGQLDGDATRNTALLRSALRAALPQAVPADPVDAMKRALLALAIDADYVLDLHCDTEARVHAYTQPAFIAPLLPLMQLLRAETILIADASGDMPFDEAVSVPWEAAKRHFSAFPFLPGGIAATIELRGQQQTEPEFGTGDSEAILGFLRHIGAASGEKPDLPPQACPVTPLAGCSLMEAPASGYLSWHRPLGALVRQGDLMAVITDAAANLDHSVLAECDGLFFARVSHRQVMAGQKLGKIAGSQPLRSGILLGP